jgi:hypothetical protein
LRWDEVAEIRVSENSVLFELHDGTVITRSERFAGIDSIALAKRANEVRRKAIFGLLN